MLEARRFGDGPVVVEEFLAGDELSLLALCDGARAVAARAGPRLQAHRRRRHGPEHGRHGLLLARRRRPTRWSTEVVATVHQPVVDELARRGTPFHGVLYAGLMLAPDGGAKVLEFNVRFGDPETQVVLPRLRSDLLALLLAATEPGGLAGAALEWDPRAAVCVVLASRGYPDALVLGRRHRRARPRCRAGAEVFHAGTAERDGEVVTAGGRVLGVTALGADRGAARAAAYAAADMITFAGRQRARGHRRMTEAPDLLDRGPGGARGASTSTRRASASSWAPRATWRPWRPPPRSSRRAASCHEVRVMSAHRDPEVVADYAKNAKLRGLRVIIAGAGLSAALPGVVAAHTRRCP